ncbi:hypothetical protein [Chengkuizengella sediminis]|uniref:hypothetical protein n=1 Tax=Chengkuizengella sediminis TaxID=1885917 RepID=UPI001F109325|nr:hypothetical protein [Chengkuizengella sediminis]
MDKELEKPVEDLDRESNVRSHLGKKITFLIAVFLIGVSIFHLYTSYAGPFVDVKQRSIHLFILMSIGFLLYPFIKKSNHNKGLIMDYVLAGVTMFTGIYMILTAERIIESGGRINNFDFIVGIVILILLLEITEE